MNSLTNLNDITLTSNTNTHTYTHTHIRQNIHTDTSTKNVTTKHMYNKTEFFKSSTSFKLFFYNEFFITHIKAI